MGISDKDLVNVIRRKVRLNQPYAGVFMKKNESDEREVIDSMSDLHPVGTFVQIHELQDMGDKLRMIVMAHRRISMTAVLPDQPLEEEEELAKSGKNIEFKGVSCLEFKGVSCLEFKGVSCLEFKGVSCLEFKGVSCLEFKGVSCLEFKGVSCLEFKGVSCLEFMGVSCLEFKGVSCLEFKGVSCLEFMGVSCLEFKGVSCLEFKGVSCLEFMGVSCLEFKGVSCLEFKGVSCLEFKGVSCLEFMGVSCLEFMSDLAYRKKFQVHIDGVNARALVEVEGGGTGAQVEVRLPPHNTPIIVAMEDKSGGEGEAGESRVQRLLRRRKRTEQPTEAAAESPETEASTETPEKMDAATQTPPPPPRVLIVQVENVLHDKFQTTEEVKASALTQEIIKTIRDIIALNPLYRESVQQMIQHGQRVVDNPVYLADLAASLTSADSNELQQVLEETKVRGH
ncbi:Lon protease, mitochondrial [Chionoecetes opilio]|uniref:Lon protease, mitochondrial n=1 Tax=Chionoecetes opilio TaxID=41210 RepID=A0A8J4XMK5_CHIOP|nr:Lon protease, mitochondrial [Chionoecetes opilio]